MDEFRLITLDPGHFHAGLIQKEMYAGVSRQVAVYAPLSTDLTEHLNRVVRFNSRADRPTRWELEIHAAPDFLERMLEDRPGNIVVLSGRNRTKIQSIALSLGVRLNVLADKPWIIESDEMPALDEALRMARGRGLIAFDIMTERFEITSMLQRELINDLEVFGTIAESTPDDPAVYMESVHHILKLVAGVPNLRPVWFFDVEEQGEALADVGTHLVDLVQWTLFSDVMLDYRKDVEVLAGKGWPTTIDAAQFKQVTGQAGPGLDYRCNTSVTYRIRGVHVKLDVLWRWEAPTGTGDTHLASYRGTRSRVEVRQDAADNYRPELYVVYEDPSVRRALEKRIAVLASQYPGVAIEDRKGEARITIPDSYRVGHEAHFAQVANQFFEYLRRPETLPAWEDANMLTKYYISTKGVELSRR